MKEKIIPMIRLELRPTVIRFNQSRLIRKLVGPKSQSLFGTTDTWSTHIEKKRSRMNKREFEVTPNGSLSAPLRRLIPGGKRDCQPRRQRNSKLNQKITEAVRSRLAPRPSHGP